VYDIGQVRHLRLRWDSFTSLCRTDESPRVAPAAETQTDEMAVAAWPAGKSLPTLLPRNTVSGIVFHDIMETLCKTDESTGGVGFSLGARPLEEALAEDGPLSDLVRRAMRRNGLGNQVRGGDSTVRTLARLVWRALNTCIEIGGRKIFLKDVAFGDRLAEVEFVVDEPSVLGLDAPWTGAAPRDGALNGKIDLLIRPDGPNGPVYLLDWKTNALPDYGKDSVEKAMEEAGYPLQFKLYALAVSRWLGREALAGVAYLFVRGGEHGENSGVSTCVMDAAGLADCRRCVRDAVASGGGSRG
jgi:hypothetical protein